MWHPAIATPSTLQHGTQRCGRNLKWKNRGQASMKKMKEVKENFGGNKQNPKKNHLRPGPTNGSREETEHPSKWLWRAKIWPIKYGRNSSLLFYISCVDRLIKVGGVKPTQKIVKLDSSSPDRNEHSNNKKSVWNKKLPKDKEIFQFFSGAFRKEKKN